MAARVKVVKRILKRPVLAILAWLQGRVSQNWQQGKGPGAFKR